MTEGGALKALTKYTGNHSEYHVWSFSARRVLTRADERLAELLQWISGQVDEVKENDVLECRSTTDLSSTDIGMAQLRHRAALLTESVTHPERVLKVTDLPQDFYQWESSLKEFQRGRPAELDDDVKANAMRHMMPKETLDAVDLQPQYRTFSKIRGYLLQQARQRADVYLGDVCHSTKKTGTVTPRARLPPPQRSQLRSQWMCLR